MLQLWGEPASQPNKVKKCLLGELIIIGSIDHQPKGSILQYIDNSKEIVEQKGALFK